MFDQVDDVETWGCGETPLRQIESINAEGDFHHIKENNMEMTTLVR